MHPEEEDCQCAADFSHKRNCYALVPVYSCQTYTFDEQEPCACLHLRQKKDKQKKKGEEFALSVRIILSFDTFPYKIKELTNICASFWAHIFFVLNSKPKFEPKRTQKGRGENKIRDNFLRVKNNHSLAQKPTKTYNLKFKILKISIISTPKEISQNKSRFKA